MAAPFASATGALLRVGVGSQEASFGSNVFGGAGDTVDIGVMNAQCSDAGDFVDVGIANQEGGFACPGRECKPETRGKTLADLFESDLDAGSADERADSCGDENDTIDIGVLNEEGNPWTEEGGDDGDGVDVSIGSNEYGDDEDAVDIGVLHCEYRDRHDGFDVGVWGIEYQDHGDTFDVSFMVLESDDHDDGNAIDLDQFAPPMGHDCRGGSLRPALLP